MSDYPNVDLLIEAIDEEPAGPLTSVGVALVRKGWAHGQEVAEAEISTLRQQLDQAAPGSGWIRCSEEMPKRGQRVRLFSQGVIQHYMPVLDEGDEGPFWSFDGICDYDPPVDFKRDQWKPMDQPPQGEG